MSHAAVTFDTLKFVETLKASGFDEPQAKGMAAAIREVQQTNLDELATKGDIKELEAKIEASKADTINWTTGMFVAQTALIIGAMFGMMKMTQPSAPVQYVAPPGQEMRLPAPPPAR
ncbi:MAG: DUF1640 domain-containing protein [Magnetococcales bacterium]|nr:DUF1640 domain-containing protein [Magnetococcales bacterium]